MWNYQPSTGCPQAFKSRAKSAVKSSRQAPERRPTLCPACVSIPAIKSLAISFHSRNWTYLLPPRSLTPVLSFVQPPSRSRLVGIPGVWGGGKLRGDFSISLSLVEHSTGWWVSSLRKIVRSISCGDVSHFWCGCVWDVGRGFFCLPFARVALKEVQAWHCPFSAITPLPTVKPRDGEGVAERVSMLVSGQCWWDMGKITIKL